MCRCCSASRGCRIRMRSSVSTTRRRVAVVTPITDGAVAVDWERAEIADFTVDYLLKAPPTGATFAEVPGPPRSRRTTRPGRRISRSGSAQSQSIELFKSTRAKVVSAPDESERDFRIRLQSEAREARDAALARVREKYASKIDADPGSHPQGRAGRAGAERTGDRREDGRGRIDRRHDLWRPARAQGDQRRLARSGDDSGARHEPGRQGIAGRDAAPPKTSPH